MINRTIAVSFCFLALLLSATAQSKKSHASAAPDKAYLQKIWDGWATLNPDSVSQYYATGPNTFFDIAPLKYSSWDEYEKGSKALIAEYKSAKFTLNDDTTIHPAGNLAWVTATVAFELIHTSGKVDMGNMRWTAILENQDGKWIIVHEHVSVPMQ